MPAHSTQTCHPFHFNTLPLIAFETLPAIPVQSRPPTDVPAIKNSTRASSIFGYPDCIDERLKCCVAADFKWKICVKFSATDCNPLQTVGILKCGPSPQAWKKRKRPFKILRMTARFAVAARVRLTIMGEFQ
ncbi:hypothetical protein [Propionivibrio sp.]|uniref:hypothetical protein n=1 Tax=Propionivibrio sp. TaxID=2212460 RepID=UPI003BF31B26